MAYKKNKTVPEEQPKVEEVPLVIPDKKTTKLKNELVNLYKELDSISIEEENVKIENLKTKLQKIIEEYDSFLKEDNIKNLATAEAKACEGEMIVKRYPQTKRNVVKDSDCSVPFKFGMKDLMIFILIITCFVLCTAIAMLVNA